MPFIFPFSLSDIGSGAKGTVEPQSIDLCVILFMSACLDTSVMQVWSPNMYNMQLWETSGHAANYKENMFVFEVKFLCGTSCFDTTVQLNKFFTLLKNLLSSGI